MSSIIISGDTSGTATIQAPSVAGTPTLTLPTTSGTILTTGSTFAGTGPLFSANVTTGVSQTISHNTTTKVTALPEQYDTNNNYTSSTFTPTVAGYYQINAEVTLDTTNGRAYGIYFHLYKNGSAFISTYSGLTSNSNRNLAVSASGPIYCNGSTDYIELYIYQYDYTASGSVNLVAGTFAGSLVRAA
jgi:hypothetical protein